jgi:hypothetical protein
LQPHLKGKSTFLENFESLDDHISLEVIGNSTKEGSLHDILLEKFKNLKPIESAAISVGCGAGIIFLVLAIVCFWKLSSFTWCRKKSSDPTATTDRQPLTQEEVLKRSQAILEGYLYRLNPNRHQQPQNE